MKLIWQTRTKTDPIDAFKLAEFARVGMLPALWVPDPWARTLRQALRGRVFLVRQRTVIRNRVQAREVERASLSTAVVPDGVALPGGDSSDHSSPASAQAMIGASAANTALRFRATGTWQSSSHHRHGARAETPGGRIGPTR